MVTPGQVVKPPPTVEPFEVFTHAGSCEPPKGFFLTETHFIDKYNAA